MSRESNALLLRALDAEDMRLRKFGALKDEDNNVIPTLAGQAAALIRRLEYSGETLPALIRALIAAEKLKSSAHNPLNSQKITHQKYLLYCDQYRKVRAAVEAKLKEEEDNV